MRRSRKKRMKNREGSKQIGQSSWAEGKEEREKVRKKKESEDGCQCIFGIMPSYCHVSGVP
jgi:hypothetical protein